MKASEDRLQAIDKQLDELFSALCEIRASVVGYGCAEYKVRLKAPDAALWLTLEEGPLPAGNPPADHPWPGITDELLVGDLPRGELPE